MNSMNSLASNSAQPLVPQPTGMAMDASAVPEDSNALSRNDSLERKMPESAFNVVQGKEAAGGSYAHMTKGSLAKSRNAILCNIF